MEFNHERVSSDERRFLMAAISFGICLQSPQPKRRRYHDDEQITTLFLSSIDMGAISTEAVCFRLWNEPAR